MHQDSFSETENMLQSVLHNTLQEELRHICSQSYNCIKSAFYTALRIHRTF